MPEIEEGDAHNVPFFLFSACFTPKLRIRRLNGLSVDFIAMQVGFLPIALNDSPTYAFMVLNNLLHLEPPSGIVGSVPQILLQRGPHSTRSNQHLRNHFHLRRISAYFVC